MLDFSVLKLVVRIVTTRPYGINLGASYSLKIVAAMYCEGRRRSIYVCIVPRIQTVYRANAILEQSKCIIKAQNFVIGHDP